MKSKIISFKLLSLVTLKWTPRDFTCHLSLSVSSLTSLVLAAQLSFSCERWNAHPFKTPCWRQLLSYMSVSGLLSVQRSVQSQMFGRELLCLDSVLDVKSILLTFVPASFVLKLTHGNALQTSEFLSPVSYLNNYQH